MTLLWRSPSYMFCIIFNFEDSVYPLTTVLDVTGDPSWNNPALEEWSRERGIIFRSTSGPTARAAAWLARELAIRKVQPRCAKCAQHSCTCMRCQECSREFCHKCLSMEPDCVWDIEFCCPACVVDGLFLLPIADEPGSPYLLHLALQTMKSSSARLALSTWRNYLRCVRKAVDFTAKHGVLCFPVVNERTMRGAMIFFQHLRHTGTSWSSMRVYRSAWKSFHEVLGILDPWLAFPALARMTAGLQKQVCVPARPRVGLSIEMLKEILA